MAIRIALTAAGHCKVVFDGSMTIYDAVTHKRALLEAQANTEDMEIAFRIQSRGYRIENCPTAEVYTITPRTVKKLYRQRTRWIYGFIQNTIDYRRIFLNRNYGNIGMFTLPSSL